MRARPQLPAIDPDLDARSVRWGWAICVGCARAYIGWQLLGAAPLRIAMLAWLERRIEPRAGAFARWLDTQVLRPHRRRAEIAGRSEPAQQPPDAARQTAARRNE